MLSRRDHDGSLKLPTTSNRLWTDQSPIRRLKYTGQCVFIAYTHLLASLDSLSRALGIHCNQPLISLLRHSVQRLPHPKGLMTFQGHEDLLLLRVQTVGCNTDFWPRKQESQWAIRQSRSLPVAMPVVLMESLRPIQGGTPVDQPSTADDDISIALAAAYVSHACGDRLGIWFCHPAQIV